MLHKSEKVALEFFFFWTVFIIGIIVGIAIFYHACNRDYHEKEREQNKKDYERIFRGKTSLRFEEGAYSSFKTSSCCHRLLGRKKTQKINIFTLNMEDKTIEN